MGMSWIARRRTRRGWAKSGIESLGYRTSLSIGSLFTPRVVIGIVQIFEGAASTFIERCRLACATKSIVVRGNDVGEVLLDCIGAERLHPGGNVSLVIKA